MWRGYCALIDGLILFLNLAYCIIKKFKKLGFFIIGEVTQPYDAKVKKLRCIQW